MLSAENLSMRYFRKTGQANHFFAVRNANLTLRAGEVVLLMGRSGSGKTTLLHMLAGLLTPTEGRVRLDETDMYGLPDSAFRTLWASVLSRMSRLTLLPKESADKPRVAIVTSCPDFRSSSIMGIPKNRVPPITRIFIGVSP